MLPPRLVHSQSRAVGLRPGCNMDGCREEEGGGEGEGGEAQQQWMREGHGLGFNGAVRT